VSGDPVMLAQGLSNLIDNALKYAPPYGAIEVGVEKTRADTVEISVADNGPGIEESEKSKVTQRFYRGDASRGTPGVGLGLSLVQAVAKLHGAQVDLRDNSPGLRAVITLQIDTAAAIARDSAPIEAPATESSTSPTLATLP
jgi:signal transduction histidine kinase